MERNKWKLTGLSILSCLFMAVSCQKAQQSEVNEFVNVLTIPDSVASPEQLAEKERIIGFFLNEKVMQCRDGRIELIADSSMFNKNDIDIRYMSYCQEQLEETNEGSVRMLNDGTIPQDSFPGLVEKAFREAQRVHARQIVE